MSDDPQQGAPADEPHTGNHAASSAPSRRSLLRGGGLIAAGLAVGIGGAAGIGRALNGDPTDGTYVPEHFNAPKPRPETGFDHLVVMMGENRSFDNLLGYLYTPDAPPSSGKFDGLAFGTYSNAASDGTAVPAHRYTGPTDWIMSQPDPDPGEEYPHVNTQLFGHIDDGNFGVDVGEMHAPYNLPDDVTDPRMDGFVRDYESTLAADGKSSPSTRERDKIMGSFDPQMLPVLSTLAREFGVYDHWFCAVPSQTFCNRSFFHASTSHGFVTNKHGGGYDKWLNAPAAPTVFNRLEDAGLSWRVYFDELQLLSFTGMLHAPVLEKYWRTEHFAPMSQYFDDAKNGNLPAYAFIEPRMIFNHNDFHPPVGALREGDEDGQELESGAISDVRAGDALVHDVYTAIRNSTSEHGSNYLNTVLLFTFDEHGGTYDHAAPPSATPPDSSGAGEMGFEFNRLGCRVPAILVSAYVDRGSVFNEQMHHGALASSLSERFGVSSLTERDHGAPTIRNGLNRKIPRHISDWPQTSPAFVPPNPESGPHPAESHPDRPLSPPARGLIGILLERYGTAEEKAHPPETFGDAYKVLVTYGKGLFGVQK